MEIKGIKKLIALNEELSESDFYRNFYSSGDKIPKVFADVFIYSYKNGEYDGSGFAVWRNDGEWAYDYLGHCSCDGPTQNLETADNAKFPLEKILEIIEKEYNWSDEMKILSNYLKQHYLSRNQTTVAAPQE